MEPSGPPIEQIKAAMRLAWMAGDFGVIAKTMARYAEEFVARLRLTAGAHVLDVACGSGNLAIPLARQGCVVTGVDIAPNLVEQARHAPPRSGSMCSSTRAMRSNCPTRTAASMRW